MTVDPLKDAQNPGGLVEDLVVTVEGPNAENAEVSSDGTVKVTPTDERQAIAYRLTNEVDELSAMAFVIVPPSAGADAGEDEEQIFPPPYLAELGPQIVRMNGTISWKVADIVIVPSGNPARILSANATNSDGSSPMRDSKQLTFTPAKDFRGQAAVTFEVTDGESADDPKGRKAVLTIPVTVGDPNFEDVPPTFTPRAIQVEAGEPRDRGRPAPVERTPERQGAAGALLQRTQRADVGDHGRHRREHPVGERPARRAARHEGDPRVLGGLQGVLGPGLDRGRGRLLVAAEDAGARRRPVRDGAEHNRSRSPCWTTTSIRSPTRRSGSSAPRSTRRRSAARRA